MLMVAISAETRSVTEISRETRDVAQLARADRPSLDEITGGAFTTGMSFTAVISPPAAAILAARLPWPI